MKAVSLTADELGKAFTRIARAELNDLCHCFLPLLE